MERVKRLPYGMTDFERIIREKYYYVDKTDYIEKIEDVSSFFFFVRPRRFGKSLFLNMLAIYYDCNRKEQFEEVFGGLKIGKNPTENRNKYLVLSLNFSSVPSSPEEMVPAFNVYCCDMLAAFVMKYVHLIGDDVLAEVLKRVDEKISATSMLSYVCSMLELKGLKMYLVLDEYDNFANNVLVNHGEPVYHNYTHGDGFFRTFLKIVKDYSKTVIERMYITGVSPVTMDDLTSGFNIADNYSSDARFNNMIGFNEAEVREMLEYYQSQGKFTQPVDEIITLMKPWYDNYCFAEDSLDEPPMYNSDMVLYFTNRLVGFGQAPKDMLDTNIRTDYNKLRHLLKVDKQFGENASVIKEVVEKGYTTGVIADTFPALDIVKTKNFKSLLYYYGMLTISGYEMGELQLRIPNLTVREQLYGYIIDIYKDTADLYIDTDALTERCKHMAYFGEWQPYFEYIADRLNSQSSIRDFIEGEAHVKAFMLAYLGLSNYYIVRPEYESNKGYADLFMQPRLVKLPDMKFSYCIELKYAKRDAPEEKIEQLLEEARTQLKQYATSEWIQQDKGTTKLKCIALVFHGWKLVRVECVEEE